MANFVFFSYTQHRNSAWLWLD